MPKYVEESVGLFLPLSTHSPPIRDKLVALPIPSARCLVVNNSGVTTALTTTDTPMDVKAGKRQFVLVKVLSVCRLHVNGTAHQGSEEVEAATLGATHSRFCEALRDKMFSKRVLCTTSATTSPRRYLVNRRIGVLGLQASVRYA